MNTSKKSIERIGAGMGEKEIRKGWGKSNQNIFHMYIKMLKKKIYK